MPSWSLKHLLITVFPVIHCHKSAKVEISVFSGFSEPEKWFNRNIFVSCRHVVKQLRRDLTAETIGGMSQCRRRVHNVGEGPSTKSQREDRRSKPATASHLRLLELALIQTKRLDKVRSAVTYEYALGMTLVSINFL